MSQFTLTPEQKNAYATFMQYKLKLHSLLHLSAMINKDKTLLPTNFVAASYKPFLKANLPREQHWTWNQSNAKVSVRVDDTTLVTFRKINPKKRNGASKAPSFKVWLYQIHTEYDSDQYFLWCEKGVDTALFTLPSNFNGVSTEIGTIFPQQISIESLSFLHPFTDTQTAIELGWVDGTLCK